MIPKILILAVESLSIPFDRARQVILGTSIETFGTGSWTNLSGLYSNFVLTSLTSKKTVYSVFRSSVEPILQKYGLSLASLSLQPLIQGRLVVLRVQGFVVYNVEFLYFNSLNEVRPL